MSLTRNTYTTKDDDYGRQTQHTTYSADEEVKVTIVIESESLGRVEVQALTSHAAVKHREVRYPPRDADYFRGLALPLRADHYLDLDLGQLAPGITDHGAVYVIDFSGLKGFEAEAWRL